MSAASSAIIFSGFTVIPIAYSPDSTHYLYARKHAGPKSARGKGSKASKTTADLPDGRTLFAVNVPPDATERELVVFFKYCGTVEKVLFDFMGERLENSDSEDESDGGTGMKEDDNEKHEEGKGEGGKPRKKKRKTQNEEEVPKVVPLPTTPTNIRKLRKTGRTAHIIFLDASSLDRLFSQSTPSSKAPRPWPTSEEPTGLAHYVAQYGALRPPLDAIKEHVDSCIRVYDYEQEKTKQKSRYKKGEAVVDEDGFTLVVRGGAYGQALGGGVAVASKRFQQTGTTSERGAKKRKKASEGKEGFYAFRKAEKQRNGVYFRSNFSTFFSF